jgi:hypothetical protein
MGFFRRKSLVWLLVVSSTACLLGCGSGDDSNGGGSQTPSGGTGSGTSTGGDDEYAAERKACVERINGFRASIGQPALAAWTEQAACTDAAAKSDSASGKAHGAFGSCSELAQNECPGWGSVDDTIQNCLQNMWDEGPGEPYAEHGHYINMSEPSYTRVACGFYVRADGKVWAIQNFR